MHDPSTLPNGPTLSAAERAEWLRRGADAVPALRSFIRDHEASANDDYACAHAVDLLVELGGPEEIPFLLDLLGDDSMPDTLADGIEAALPRFGAALVEPACARIERHHAEMSVDHLGTICSCLAKTGIRSERIFGVLLRAVARQPKIAEVLAKYGDVRALPLLAHAIATFDGDPADPGQGIAMGELRETFESLGGVLDERLRSRCDEWRLRNRMAWLAWRRWADDHGKLPDLGDSSTIEELRALLPNLAEMQLFGFLARELGRMSEAVAFARECERIAVRTAGPARESAIAATKHPALAEQVVYFYEALAAGTARS